MLKKILLVVAIALGAVVGVGVARGRDWRVERSTTINATPETLVPLLTDFEHGWTQWSIWSSMDPQAKWSFKGTPGTVGHAMTWAGPSVGGGTLTITSIEPTKIVLEGAIESDQKNDTTTFTLQPQGTSTTLTWLDEGKAPPVIGGLFKGKLERMLGNQFEQNLAKLKTVAEQKQAEASKPTPEPQMPTPTPTPTTTEPTPTQPTQPTP